MKKAVKEEYSLATLRGMIGAIPFAGTFINEIVFEARTRLKQERVNLFIKEFGEYLKSNNTNEIQLDKIKKEDFGDMFEEIIFSISKTSSQHKIEIFKKILWNQISGIDLEIELVHRYISITNAISKFQFLILTEFSSLSDSVLNYKVQILEMEKELVQSQAQLQSESQLAKKGYENNTVLLEKRIKYISKSINSKKKALKECNNPSLSKTYSIKNSDFLIEVHDLISKGLLYDLAMTSEMIRINDNFGITKLGRSYIDYIRQVDNSTNITIKN